MKKLLIAALILGCAGVPGGTLIYLNKNGEERLVSNIKILSINRRLITLSINDGIETMPISNVVKYYDSDIRGGVYEDDTNEYDISIDGITIPKRTKSVASSSGGKGRSQVNKVAFNYDVRQKVAAERKNITKYREPYFYLFLMTAEDGVRRISQVAYPNKARVSGKIYDEARMLEKALDLKRVTIEESARDTLGQSRNKGNTAMGMRKVEIPLNGAADGEIIAWCLIVWGKNKIIYAKEERVSGNNIEDRWFLKPIQ